MLALVAENWEGGAKDAAAASQISRHSLGGQKQAAHCLQQLTEGTRGTIVGETSFKLGQDSLQSVMHDPEKAEEHWKEVEAFSTNCLNSQFHCTFFAQYQGLPGG